MHRTLVATLAFASIVSVAVSQPGRASPEPSAGERAARRWAGNPSARTEVFLERGWRPSPRALAQEFLHDFWRISGAPAISAAVLSDGDLVFSGGVGFSDLSNLVPATGSTVYNVGSISKVISVVAVMQLVEQGAVDLDDPIQKYVPTFPEKRWPVTVRHVLTHTAGIRHYRDDDFPDTSVWNMNWKPFDSYDEAVGIFAGDPLLFEPGTRFLYTSYGANLMQGIVETASGLGFEEYLEEHVFRPAGMLRSGLDRTGRIVPGRATGYLVDAHGVREHPWEDVSYKWAGGGMISTVEDLVRFGQAILDGSLLEPETVEEMFRPRLDGVLRYREGEPATPIPWRQALMWRIRTDEAGRDYVHHCGTVVGFNACLAIYVDEGLVVAVADNAASSGLWPAKTIAGFFLDGDESSVD